MEAAALLYQQKQPPIKCLPSTASGIWVLSVSSRQQAASAATTGMHKQLSQLPTSHHACSRWQGLPQQAAGAPRLGPISTRVPTSISRM